MATLQQIRGIYERIVIDAASAKIARPDGVAVSGNVPVFVENQSAIDFDALDEYCLLYVSFGLTQEPAIGCEYMEMIRGSLVCEIYTRKNIGPGRGLQLAQPMIQALCSLNGAMPGADQGIIPKVGRVQGPTQAQLQDRPHHFTRFSMPIYARVTAIEGAEPQLPTFIFNGDWL